MQSGISKFARGLAAFACAAELARAQDPQPQPPPPQDLQKQIEEMRKAHDAEIEDLRDEIDKLAEQVSEASRKSQTPAQQPPSIFNPAITAFGNFYYSNTDKPVFLDNDPNEPEVNDQFRFREAELDIRAPIDPWADGVLIASFEEQAQGDYSTGIEEGYVLLKKLPGLDSAPGGLKVKTGRFRPAFGRFNTIHLHDLPAPTYPFALQTFLGPEGFIADGISGEFFLPSPSDKDVLDATVQVIDGGQLPIDPTGDSSDIATLAHVKWFRDLSEGHDLEVGTSFWTSNSADQLYGLDATYHWKPFLAGEWHSFLFGAELYQADLSGSGFSPHPNGFDLWSQYQIDRNLYIGVRFSQADDLADESLHTKSYGTFLTYYTTEFLRFRVGYEHSDSDLAQYDGLDSASFELNFVIGSHPAEPYWVNL